MRLQFDVGWLHVDVSLGPDEPDDEDEAPTTLAYPDRVSAEPVGFASFPLHETDYPEDDRM